MKKRVMSLLGILLAGAMLLSACGETAESGSAAGSTSETAAASTKQTTETSTGASTEATTSDDAAADALLGEVNTEVEPVEVTIAFCCWGFADEASMTYQKQLNYLSQGMMTLEQPVKVNWEWITCISPEEQLTNLEAIHEKGIDGAIILYLTEAMVDTFNNWQMPFVSYNDFPEEVEAYAETSSYYLGTLDNRTDILGEQQMTYAIEELGCKAILCVGNAPGLPNQDMRFDGYESVAAKHSDVVLYESRSDELRADVITNMLFMHPDIDAIIDTTASGGNGDAVIQVLRTNGLGHGEVKYLTYDFIDDQIQAMDDGIIVFTQAGGQQSICHLFIALLNSVMGTPINDHATLWRATQITITSTEDYKNYEKYFAGKIPMFTLEEYEQFLKWINPDVDAEAFNTFLMNTTLEGVMERHAHYFE